MPKVLHKTETEVTKELNQSYTNIDLSKYLNIVEQLSPQRTSSRNKESKPVNKVSEGTNN